MVEADFASIREVHALLEAADAKTAAAIKALGVDMRQLFKDHDAHHDAEERKRAGRTRWLVTTALAFGGLAGGLANHLLETLAR